MFPPYPPPTAMLSHPPRCDVDEFRAIFAGSVGLKLSTAEVLSL